MSVGTTTEGTAASNLTVRVMAGPEMGISCSSNAGPYTSECSLSGWTFQAKGTRFQATKRVWVRPLSGSTQATWSILFDGEGLAPRRSRVSAGRDTLPPLPVGNAVPFQGNVTIRTQFATLPYSAQGAPETKLTVPVQAWVNNDFLLLYDESRILSPTGKLRVERNQNFVEFSWLPSTTAAGDRATVDALTAVIGNKTFSGLPAGARSLSGRFNINFLKNGSEYLSLEYALSRTRDAVVACGTSLPACSGGTVCEAGLQVCAPGTVWTSLGNNASPRNTLIHEQFKAWNDSGAQQLASAPGDFGMQGDKLAQGVLCDPGEGQDPVATFTSTVLNYSGELACSTGRPTYFARLNTQRDLRAVIPGAPVLESRQMLQACASDLQVLPQGTQPAGVRSFFQQRLQNPAQCFSVARTFDALALLGSTKQTSRDRLRWYLMQQWIGAHAFVASQTALQRKSYDYLGDNAEVQLPTLANSLDQFERGWELFLSSFMPFVGGDFGIDGACEFKNPDYRLPSNPVDVWTLTGGDLLQTRYFNWWLMPQGSDLTFMWYPDPSKQDSCSRYTAENCAANPALCPQHPSRCGLGYYPILGFGEGVNGDLAHKFYVYKYAAEYMSGPDEALIVEHTSGGQRHFASYELPFMFGRLSDAPIVARRKAGQYQFFDANHANGPIESSSNGYYLPTDYSAPFIEDEPPLVGDVPQSTAGIVLFDHALSDAELRVAAGRSFSSYLNRAGERLPPSGNLPHHEQGIGLPTAALEGVTAHLELLNAELERVARTTSCGVVTPGSPRALVVERFGRTLRQALSIESTAGLQQRQMVSAYCEGNTQMASGVEARFKQARAELEATRNRAQRTLQAMLACQSTEIPENEAPLLFRSVTGDSERFFASSDYIKTYAESALLSAEANVAAARTAWEQQRVSGIQQTLSTQDAARRVERLQAEYGQPLVQACGLDVEAKDALALFDPTQPNALTPESCYVAKQTPECDVSISTLVPAVTQEQARSSMCLWYELQAQGLITLPSPFSNVIASWTTATVSNGFVSANGKQFETKYLYQPPFTLDRVPTTAIANSQQLCRMAWGGDHPLPSPVDLGKGLSNTCYRGELGTARLGITAAAQSLQVARAAWADAQDRYDIASGKCTTLVVSQGQRTALRAARDAEMIRLSGAKETADRIGAGFNSLDRSLGLAEQGAQLGAAAGPVGAAIGAGVGFVVGLFGADAADDSVQLQQEIFLTDLEFQGRVDVLNLGLAVTQCLADARLSMEGIKTAALQVDRAVTDVELSLLKLRNMTAQVQQSAATGLAVVQREKGRTVASVAHHYWLDEHISEANESFEWARRLTYLLALSLEYEMQRSLVERQAALDATRPAQLRSTYNTLLAMKFVAKVGNRSPGEDTVFISLRDEVLKLASHENAPEGERAFTRGERFARRISAPQHAVFDRQGHYLGQGIQFSMPVPNGLAHRCAERLWSVRANMVGNIVNWPQAQGAQLLLYKRNTFQSRWCGSLGLGDGSRYQVRVHSPTVDLSGQPPLVTAAGTNAWSVASIQSRLNEPAGSWTSLPCNTQSGCSDELAGRGFFGDYMVVLPEAGLLANGFPVSAVEDVMLAFEVESVSNAPEPGSLKAGEEVSRQETDASSCEAGPTGIVSCSM
ncbi:hypothetical protein D7Y13_05500 [Corallococcus praedator]|uniref:Uncharacterized protein n=1 Tax=Corallococcus praedator TaxID=2316724 RepID=A0ABX9QPQ1_9BACT|nr:hypothetical protein [Corallococcus sp. CA031C]RKH33613.1 hypothetical protein D7X75_11410 [Corallococcus sp. CA031C]RKI14811.1 hypothetical protein D7Y13_05500 [Corallococcus praedator]